MSQTSATNRVVITGLGLATALGTEPDLVFAALCAGQSGIRPITRFEASTFAVRWAAQATPVDLPGPVEILAKRDTKVGLGFHAATQALAGRRLDRHALLHLGTGLEVFNLADVVQGGCADLAAVVRRSYHDGPSIQIPLDTCNRLLAHHLGQPGWSLTNCSACAAGAQAIGQAFHAVRSGRAAWAVAGGHDAMVTPLGLGGFQLLGALVEGDRFGPRSCRPFDRQRVGTVLGEGAAVLVLEPLVAALASRRRILAEVCGYGSSLDAHALSAPDPEGQGAERAMRAALADAGLPPQMIGHISAHGTGTILNDPCEAAAIRRVFADTWPHLPVTAIKSMLGHTIGAAGALAAAVAALSLARDRVPPNPSLAEVAPDCRLCHLTQPQPAGAAALVNSFGFGGQNASLVLRRWDGDLHGMS